MAQLLLAGTQMVCGLPGAKIVGPVVLPLVPFLPLNIVAYVAWLLGLKLSKAKWTQSLAPTWRKAAIYALPFYFATMLPLYAICLLAVCRAVG